MGEAAWSVRKVQQSTACTIALFPPCANTRFDLSLGDATKPHVSCSQALIGAIALARALRTHWDGQHTVGLLLPPSVGGALANVAATLSGRTTVNLNYTAGMTGLESASKQAGLVTVLTNRVFLEKAKVELPPNLTPIWIEDVRESD